MKANALMMPLLLVVLAVLVACKPDSSAPGSPTLPAESESSAPERTSEKSGDAEEEAERVAPPASDKAPPDTPASPTSEAGGPSEEAGGAEAITGTNYKAAIESTPVALLEFGADYCGPCKALEPILHTLANDYRGKLTVGIVDCVADPDLAQTYKVQLLPTLVFVVNGEEVERLTGLQEEKTLRTRIDDLLKQAEAG